MLLNNCPKQTIPLAIQGEYGNKYSFDATEWIEQFGEGSVGWLIQRPNDIGAYPLPDTEEGNISTITLTETETQFSGTGVLEVFFVNTGATDKRISHLIPFYIEPSLMSSEVIPEPWESYVDAVHADAVAAEEARRANENMSATAEMANDDYGVPFAEVEKSMVDDHVNLGFSFGNLRGNGIESIELIATSADYLERTYRITFSDETYFDFIVTDGVGIASITKVKSGLTTNITIYLTDGGSFSFSVDDGVGISSAVLNDNYTLTLNFTNGTSYTTPSIRGEKGEKGDTGNVYYATFEIDPLTGLLNMIYDDDYEGPTFFIDANGYMGVSINA